MVEQISQVIEKTPEDISYYNSKRTIENHLDLLKTIDGKADLRRLVGETNLKRYLREVNRKEELRREYIELISGREKKWGEASEILVDYIKDNYYIYCTRNDEKTEMWIYEEGIYIPHGKMIIKEILREILDKFFSTYICNLVISKLEVDNAINTEEFFKVKYVNEIPVKNGLLNIFTKELNKFDPNKIFFNKIPVNFDQYIKCPKIDKFFKSVLKDEEDVKVLYELIGYSLLSEYRYEKAFMFVGDGRNGKGKTMDLIKRFIGADNCSSISLSSLNPESFSISELFGKKINLAGDIGNEDLKDTSMFKSLTGRDLITGKRKFLPNIYFENHAKFVFACNELPMVYDISRGFWERWVLLEFPYTFVSEKEYKDALDNTNLKQRDENIIKSIISEEELSGLLNESLNAFERLRDKRDFSVTRGSKQIKELWIRKANSFMAFAIDCLVDDYDSIISKRDLRKKYSEYCKKHSIPIKSDIVIKKVLTGDFGANDEYTEVKSNEIYSKREWVWRGIKWK